MFSIFNTVSKITIFLTLSVAMLLLNKSVVAQSSTRESKDSTATKRPAPPRRIPPNKVKPGGGLDLSYQSCKSEKLSLTALVPIDNPVLTTQSYPSFLFYVPDRGVEIDYGEFSLFTASEKTRVFSTRVDLTNAPGIIKIDLPHAPEYALEVEQSYHWYFKVSCQTEADAPIFLDVNGWIERIPATSTTEQHLSSASPDIWYDAIAITARNLLATPQDPTVRDRKSVV